jgi:hypothetical protein
LNQDPDSLHKLFAGKNTLEAARVLADIFVTRFGQAWGVRGEILKRLLPKGRASSWAELDRHLSSFCRQFYGYEENAEKIEFLDKARFVIQSLPQRQDYKLDENKEEYPTPEETAYHFATCSLCWRAVMRRPLEKKTPLCHIHDLPSTNSEYRRRARMREQVEQRKLELVKALPGFFGLRHRDNVDLDSYLYGLCLNPDSLLYLAEYLHSLSCPPLSLPLQTAKNILEALEHPIYHRLPPHIREAWDCYLEDRGKHFKLNYVKILSAEAWLEVDAKRQHGGKRR